MSKAFTSEETPDASIAGRAVRRAEPGQERPITPEGQRALSQELRRLLEEERPALQASEEVGREARRAELDHRIALLQATLASVRIVEGGHAAPGVARFGSTLAIEWSDGRAPRVREVRIVGPDEADAKAGQVSSGSPLGRSLLGRRAGDEVEVELPRGLETVTIVRVD